MLSRFLGFIVILLIVTLTQSGCGKIWESVTYSGSSGAGSQGSQYFPQYVQSNWCHDGGVSGNSKTCTLAPKIGNTLIVHCFSDAVDGVYSVSDDQGGSNTYSIDGSATNSTTVYNLLAHAPNVQGSGTFTITCSKTMTAGHLNVMVAEYSGLLNTVDLVKTGTGATANPTTSGATTTSNPNDFVISAFASDTSGDFLVSGGPGYGAVREGSGVGGGLFVSGLEDKIVSSSGNYQGVFTEPDTTGNWASVMVAYEAALIPTPSKKLLQENYSACLLGTCTTSISSTFSTNVTAGNMIWVGTYCAIGGGPLCPLPVSLVDTLGNSFTLATTISQGTDFHQIWIYYAISNASGADTITFAPNSITPTSMTLYIQEYSGISTLDQISTNIGNGNINVTSGVAPLTTAANEILTGMFGFSGNSGTFEATSGFGQQGIAYPSGSYYIQSGATNQIVFTTGSYAATATPDANQNWSAAIATFK